MIKEIITISNIYTGEYYFTTDHCQGVYIDEQGNTRRKDYYRDEGWTSCTMKIPHVTGNEKCKIVATVQDFIKVYRSGVNWILIRNPDPTYKIKYEDELFMDKVTKGSVTP